VVLDILLEEKSATVAAQHLGITRSAVSHALRRLRELLDDPILIRGEDGLTLSPLARQLKPPLRRTLGQLENLLDWKLKFDPAKSRASFTIAAGEWFGKYSLGPFMDELQKQAPGVQIHVVPPDPKVFLERMTNGELDMAIGPYQTREPELESVLLAYDRMVGVVRAGHPFAKNMPTPQAYAAASHAVVSPWPDLTNAILKEIRQWKDDAKIDYTVPYPFAVPDLVEGRDTVVTMSRVMALRLQEEKFPIAIVEPPIATPERELKLVWHRDVGQAPAQQWLRQRVISLLALLATRWSVKWEHR
jgi:DNA-binding transcriptional LysR family regulator